MKDEMSFSKIVLATDGSEGAQGAVLATIDLARFTPAIVRVVHIWNLDIHHRHGVWDVELRSEAERLAQDTVDQLTRAGVMAEKEIFRADDKHIAASIALTRFSSISLTSSLKGVCGPATWTCLVITSFTVRRRGRELMA